MSKDKNGAAAQAQPVAPAGTKFPGVAMQTRKAVHGPESRKPGAPLTATESALERLRDVLRLPRSAGELEVLSEAADRLERGQAGATTQFETDRD